MAADSTEGSVTVQMVTMPEARRSLSPAAAGLQSLTVQKQWLWRGANPGSEWNPGYPTSQLMRRHWSHMCM